MIKSANVCLLLLLTIVVGLADENAVGNLTQENMDVASLEFDRLGQLMQCKYFDTQKFLGERETDSQLGLKNSTGYVDVLYAFWLDEKKNEGKRVNYIVLKFYHTQFVDNYRTEVRFHLSNFTDDKWIGETEAVVTVMYRSTKLGSYNKTLKYQVNRRQVMLELANNELIVISEYYEQFRYFPLFYLIFCSVSIALIELTEESQAKRMSCLVAVIMSLKVLGRSVLFLTESFLAPRPIGTLMSIMAVMSMFQLIRFTYRFSNCFESHKHSRAISITIILLMSMEILLVYEPIYNIIGCLLPFLQILYNSQLTKTIKSQNAFLFSFLSHYSLILYYSICSENVFRVEPIRWAACVIIPLLMVQTIWLKYQENRAFIRKIIKKRQQLQADPEIAATQCAICLSVIGADPFIKTDCKHIFHEECLRNWIDVKNVCPLDRKEIDCGLLDQ